MFPNICKYRTESAIAQNRVECFVLKRERMEEISEAQPVFAEKLEEMCLIKSVMYGFTNQAFENLHHEVAKQSFTRMDRHIDDTKL